MNFVQQLEECLRDLASEARRNDGKRSYRGVKEAAERATLKLRSLQNGYIRAVREANRIDDDDDDDNADNGDDEKARQMKRKNKKKKRPTTAAFRSSELLHPFLLAANYPDATPKLLEISFRAMRLLMEGDAVLPSDSIQMVRVWMIQAQVAVTTTTGLTVTKTTSTSTTGSSASSSSGGNNGGQNENRDGGSGGGESGTTSSGAAAAPSSATSSSSSSSWFGWGSSSAAATAATGGGNGGSSSSGGVGGTAAALVKSAAPSGQHYQAQAQMERRAKEILSCLLQLLDCQTRYDEDDDDHSVDGSSTITRELWTNAVALGCIWLPSVPVKHTVHQAARSTVLQVLNQLFASSSRTPEQREFRAATWSDLLLLATMAANHEKPSSKRLQSLRGAFSLCKKTSRAGSSAAGLCFPPTPDMCLEIMTNVWKEVGDAGGAATHFLDADPSLMERTKGVTFQLLQEIPKPHTPVETTLRSLQWTLTFLSYHNDRLLCPGGGGGGAADTEECIELICQFIKPIALATEACRTQHEFEDGYVYQPSPPSNGFAGSSSGQPDGSPASGSAAAGESLSTLFPTPLLWKAGLALEATHLVLERHATAILCSTTTSLEVSIAIDDHRDKGNLSNELLASLAESLSDFATIGASCRDHMLQIVEFAVLQREEATSQDGTGFRGSGGGSIQKSYTFFRRAETAVASGNTAIFQKKLVAASTGQLQQESKNPDKSMCRGSSLGEALWIALQGILRIVECMSEMKQRDAETQRVLEETFAPTLAVLQHYLKRFPGSSDLVKLALRGYAVLTDVCMQEGTSMQRKAIVTSLCKLSLPSWGKHDASCRLQDHHIQCLLCLFRIIHSHYDTISLEWDIILWTLEELSVLAIASPQLSDESYHAALAIAAGFERFPAFSTCFSTESLLRLMDTLTEIAKAAMVDRDVVGGSDTVVTQGVHSNAALSSKGMTADSSSLDKDGKETISGKIMSMGVRAIYGASTEPEKAGNAAYVADRTKNAFYEDYRSDFVQRMESTKSAVRVTAIGKMPLSLALLIDVIMANSFRWQECGDEFSRMLSTLAAASPAVRPFTMDVISMLTVVHVSRDRALPTQFIGPGRLVFANPMQSQLWAVEHVDMKPKQEETEIAGDRSQSQMLAPTCDTIRTTEKADIAESSLGALFSILEGVGHQLDGDEVWSNIIMSIASLSGDPSYELDRSSPEWSSCCLQAFRCLKFVVDDFLDQLSSTSESAASTRTALLDCCSSFGRSKHDVNTSLTAIGLLWTIADQDSGGDSIDRTLSKLVMLASDSRAEVRNAAVNTLFSCIVGRGGSFSPERWERCFSECIFGVYVLVLAHTTEGEDVPVDKSQRYKMSLQHHSRDSTSKQWVTTQVLVLRGLLRVLRNYFSQLLDTTDTGDAAEEIPWFQDAWVKILDYAFEAASLCGGGRDNIDIRSIGVELLVVCCQLTSKAGIFAAAIPARVGTNMEVVNGALRSVRETQSTTSLARSHSTVTELSRQSLFLEAFEGLESFKDFVEKITSEKSSADDSLLQILQKFGTGVAQLYDCCKENELALNDGDRDLHAFVGPTGNDDDLEIRFVQIITATVMAASVGPNPRYLNQAQRNSLDLLRNMASDGSIEATKKLISFAGSSFFIDSGSPEDDIESEADDNTSSTNLVSSEAAKIVCEEAAKDSVRDVCKAFILYKVLVSFSDEYCGEVSRKCASGTRRRRYYKRIVPVIAHGVRAVANFDVQSDGAVSARDLVWRNLLSALSEMLSPVPDGKDLLKISRIDDLLVIVEAVRDFVPPEYTSELSTILSFGASKALEVAKRRDEYAKDQEDDGETWQHSNDHRDELLKLFTLCFSSSCSLDPKDSLLRVISQQALKDVLEAGDVSESESDALGVRGDVALSVCRVISQNEHIDSLVISVFSLLSKLVMSSNTELRQAAGQLLDAVDVANLLQTAQSRYEVAESRADKAEQRVEELSGTVDDLRKKNQMLRQEVAALQAASAFT